jgi:hypothetical protein
MEIEAIPFSAFQALISCTHALREPGNDGCGWYATTNRRVAGRIYIDAKTEQFHATVLHFVKAGWDVTELRCGCNAFDEAERALLQAMRELTGKRVTVKETPMRLRYGRGRTSRPTAGPDQR